MHARLALLAALLLAPSLHADELPLIPRPERVERHPGGFALAAARRILLVPDEPPVRAAAERLAALLATHGATLTLVTSNPPADGDVIMERTPGDPEAYSIEITPTRVHATGDDAGLVRAADTLAQLATGPDLPALSLSDRPRFAWRGLSLDVARHFRSAAWIMRLLDQMAAVKLNVLHWHLTDDQGWRFPVPRLPRLADEGGTQHGGAYTTDEVAQVVAHAARLAIRVVPEVDVPGHVTAALAAYPDLSCRAVKLPVAPTWGTFDDVLCPGSESPFVFLDAVVAELALRFPDRYVHLGGDEVPRTRWEQCARCRARVASEHLRGPDELQAYFLSRANLYLDRRGRRPVVWDDDRAHGFPQGTVVQVWHGDAALLEVLTAGQQAIASPAAQVYLDRPAVATPLARVLAFEPVPRAATPEQARRVLGAEACLWTEHLVDEAACERALFPRLLAFAEVLWSPAGPRDPAEFLARLAPHRARLAAAGLAAGDPAARVALLSPRQLAGDWRQIKIDVTRYIEGPGVYNVALGADAPYPVELLAVRLERDGEKQVEILRETSTRHDVTERIYDLALKVRPPGGTWTLQLVARCQGPFASMASVWMERTPLEYR